MSSDGSNHGNRPHIILLSGIPATGKSTYGRWLEKNKGFIHLDVENETRGLKKNLASGFFSSTSSIPHLEELKKLGAPVLLDWGFPPENLSFVQKLKQEGVTLWWFNGDHDAARRAFIARNTVAVECLDIQMPKIVRCWDQIKQVFHPNILEVLKSNDRRMNYDQIFDEMFS